MVAIITDLVNISQIACISISSLKGIQASALFFIWIKMMSYGRGFPAFAFLIRMIINVIYDIKVFLMFLFAFAVDFAFCGKFSL